MDNIPEIFRHLDRTNRGFLTVDQLVLDIYQSHGTFNSLVAPVKPLELRAIIFRLLGQRTNEIREADFVQLVQKIQSQCQSQKSK